MMVLQVEMLTVKRSSLGVKNQVCFEYTTLVISVGKLYIVKERCSEWRESLGISMCVTVKTMGDT